MLPKRIRRMGAIATVIIVVSVLVAIISMQGTRVRMLCLIARHNILWLGEYSYDSLGLEASKGADQLILMLGVQDTSDSPHQWRLIRIATSTGNPATLNAALDIAQDDTNKGLALLMLDALADSANVTIDERIDQWLRDSSIAWKSDAPRYLRRCDLAACYFRRDMGNRPFDQADCLDKDVAVRDAFVARVQQARQAARDERNAEIDGDAKP